MKTETAQTTETQLGSSIFGRVLVGIDGSPESVEAARQAATLAQGPVTLLAAYDLVAGLVGGVGPATPAMVGEAALRATAEERLELAHDALGHVVDVPRTLVGRDPRVEDNLQQHVAQLLAQPLAIVGVDRLERLVRLLEQVPGERAVRLLPVPRAATGCTQTSHHADEVKEPFAAAARWDRPLGDVPELVVTAHERVATAWARR